MQTIVDFQDRIQGLLKNSIRHNIYSILCMYQVHTVPFSVILVKILKIWVKKRYGDFMSWDSICCATECLCISFLLDFFFSDHFRMLCFRTCRSGYQGWNQSFNLCLPGEMRWAAMHSAVLQEILTRVYVYLTYVLDVTVRCEEREKECVAV